MFPLQYFPLLGPWHRGRGSEEREGLPEAGAGRLRVDDLQPGKELFFNIYIYIYRYIYIYIYLWEFQVRRMALAFGRGLSAPSLGLGVEKGGTISMYAETR